MRRCGAILLMGIDARRPILTFRSSPSGSSSESQRIVQGSTSPTLTRWMPPPISQGQRGPGGCRRARGHRLRGEARGGGAAWRPGVADEGIIESSAGTLLRCQKFKQWREWSGVPTLVGSGVTLDNLHDYRDAD